MKKDIQKAIEILRDGGIVIFPTDTAFGIGCMIDDENAIKRLFKIRKRPRNKAVPVLASSVDMVRKYVRKIPQGVGILMKKYWPGALTLILQCNEVKVPSLVRGGRKTLGVRIPDRKIIREIISKVGVPILGTSANFSGEKTPFKFEDLNPKLTVMVDYILKINEKLGDNVSTVIDCTVTPWKIIREGAVKMKNGK